MKGGLWFVIGSRMFPGGVHPKERVNGKEVTKGMKVEPFVASRVAISMSQHIGVPCKPIVKPGDRVLMGQMIGEPTAFLAAPIHSSVSGKVVSIDKILLPTGEQVEAVVIDNDFKDEWVEIKPAANGDHLNADQLKEIVHQAGITGMGGAMFPTAVKLIPPKGEIFDTLLINGAECEPYLSADHRIMLEETEDIIDGVAIVLKSLGIPRAIIGVEDNKKDAIAALKEKAAKHSNIAIKALPVRYPQGGEKQLIYALTKRRVPNGKLPAMVGCLVCNVGTVSAISQAVRTGKPVVERILTVGGLVNKPMNLKVRIGTSLDDVFKKAGGIKAEAKKIIYGGPMMGMAVSRTDLYVVKGCTGLLALGEESIFPEEENCIRCGRCSQGCPMKLMPLHIDQHVRKNNVGEVEKLGVMNCIECGVCSFVCPAKRQLTQSMRMGKKIVCIKRNNENIECKKEG